MEDNKEPRTNVTIEVDEEIGYYEESTLEKTPDDTYEATRKYSQRDDK